MNNTTPSQPAAAGGGDSPMQTALTQHKGYYAFLVLFLVLMSALGSFVNDMYTPALPAMCRFFGCSVPLGQMGLTMGMAGLAVGQIVLGPVSDRYGCRGVAAGRPGVHTALYRHCVCGACADGAVAVEALKGTGARFAEVKAF